MFFDWLEKSVGSVAKLTLIERLFCRTSCAFHTHISCHRICNEYMELRHHTERWVSNLNLERRYRTKWHFLCKNTARKPQGALGDHHFALDTYYDRSLSTAQKVRTLHFLSLHLWHASTTLLLNSGLSKDSSGELCDLSERGICHQKGRYEVVKSGKEDVRRVDRGYLFDLDSEVS